MKYYKLRVEFNENRQRFNRTLLVNKNINLFQLGYIIGESLGFEFKYDFLFIIEGEQFCKKEMVEESYNENYYDYKHVSLEDADLRKGLVFVFAYDLNSNYIFRVVVEDINYDFDKDVFAYCLNAKGNFIFEDAKPTLVAYLNDEIVDFDDEHYRPSNVSEDFKITDFDSEVNLDEINIMLEEDNSNLIEEDFIDSYYKN